jgi:glycine cleavage system H protein
MIPENLLYSETHEWAKIEGQTAVVGITDFAQKQLGDLTFVELPKVGQAFSAGQEMGSVESVKAASELYSPVSGEVSAVNEALAGAPEKVNQDPYGAGWMVRFTLTAVPSGLLDAKSYATIVESQAR